MAVPHGKTTRVLVDDRHLTGKLNEASSSGEKAADEATPFGVDDKEYVSGLRDASVALSGFFDGSTDSIHEKLSGLAGSDASVPLSWGVKGLAVGEMASLVDAIQMSYEVTSSVAAVVGVSVEAQATGGIDWGVSLAPHESRTSSADAAGVDQGASSSNGAVAHLHVTAASGSSPTLDVKVQESSDGTTWVDLITFDQATAASAQRKAVTGSVERHVRALWTVGGTDPDFSFAVTFARR